MSYAFIIPHLIIGCMHYELQVGERFGNFEIKQPMTFTLKSNSKFHDSLIHLGGQHCGISVIRITEELP